MFDATAFALLAVFFFSLNLVLMRKSLMKVDLIKATFIVILVGIPILLVSCILDGDFSHLYLLDVSTIVYLAFAGILEFAVGRTLQYSSARLVGASRANALSSTSAIYAVVFAILFLTEAVLIKIVFALVLIGLGSWLILLSTACFEDKGKGQGYSLKGIALGLACGAVWGATPIFVSVGVLAAKSALLSIFISTVFAAVSYYALLVGTRKNRDFRSIGKPYIGYLVLAGALVCLAQICHYYALSLAKVSYVEPLIGIQPLITLLLSLILVRSIEKINGKMVAGMLLTLVGIYFIVFT